MVKSPGKYMFQFGKEKGEVLIHAGFLLLRRDVIKVGECRIKLCNKHPLSLRNTERHFDCVIQRDILIA